MRSLPRRWVGFVATCLAVLGIGLVCGAAPVYAHAGLVSVTPADGARLTVPPSRVELAFTEDINADFVTVVLSRDGTLVALSAPVVQGPKVTTAIGTGLADGTYRVAFRVVSRDGHPISGETTFTVAAAGASGGSSAATTTTSEPSSSTTSGSDPTASATAGPTPTTSTPQGQKTDVTHPEHLGGIIAVAAFLLGGVALLLRDRRRHRARAAAAAGQPEAPGGSGGSSGPGDDLGAPPGR